jgi:hypothetical protein
MGDQASVGSSEQDRAGATGLGLEPDRDVIRAYSII